MKFTKMHGLGNDYVYVDCFQEPVEDPSALAVRVSDRHFGIGSDGLILIKPSRTADCQMDMYNADGSRSGMCGNGIRCVGKYVYDHGIVHKEQITVETLSGVKKLQLHLEAGKVFAVTVDMGEPQITSQVPEEIRINGAAYWFTGVSMGNPHAVVVSEHIDDLDLEAIGPLFECHPRFPDRTNTEFIEILGPDHLKMRVWERGTGETLACGTGACASVAAAVLAGLVKEETTVSLKGGDLKVHWNRENGHVFMTGPAVEVFHGEIQ
ncbi:MAG: diaminopimelate epimerase [Lachnospiraceae bacterium]